MTRDVNPMYSKCVFATLIAAEIHKHFREPKSILELGCGNGGNLAMFPLARCVGIDPDKENIKEARSQSKKVEVLLGDHTLLSKYQDNEFEIGFTCSVLDHIEDFGPVLAQLCRVCKKLLLLEPMIKGQPRQANKSETKFWQVTWYHDYISVLKGLGVHFTVEPFKFYEHDSGPLFHKIVVCTENYTKKSREVLQPLIVMNCGRYHNIGLHGVFLQQSLQMGINSTFYGPTLGGITKGPIIEFSPKKNINDICKQVGANLIILYRGGYKSLGDIPALTPQFLESASAPVVLIDVDFCFLRNAKDFVSRLASIHFLRHPSDLPFSKCSNKKVFPFSVDPEIYTYHSLVGREPKLCFNGRHGRKYGVRDKVLEMMPNVSRFLVKKGKRKAISALTPTEQVAFYHRHVAALADNALPYRYLIAKHFEIPATGTVLFTNGRNGLEQFLYPNSYVVYQDDCRDIPALLSSVLKNLDRWGPLMKIASDHIRAKHSNRNRWAEFVLAINSYLGKNFDVYGKNNSGSI